MLTGLDRQRLDAVRSNQLSDWDWITWREDELPNLLEYLKSWKGNNVEIELRADKRLKWSMVADIMLACAEKQIMKIHFVAKKK